MVKFVRDGERERVQAELPRLTLPYELRVPRGKTAAADPADYDSISWNPADQQWMRQTKEWPLAFPIPWDLRRFCDLISERTDQGGSVETRRYGSGEIWHGGERVMQVVLTYWPKAARKYAGSAYWRHQCLIIERVCSELREFELGEPHLESFGRAELDALLAGPADAEVARRNEAGENA